MGLRISSSRQCSQCYHPKHDKNSCSGTIRTKKICLECSHYHQMPDHCGFKFTETTCVKEEKVIVSHSITSATKISSPKNYQYPSIVTRIQECSCNKPIIMMELPCMCRS